MYDQPEMPPPNRRSMIPRVRRHRCKSCNIGHLVWGCERNVEEGRQICSRMYVCHSILDVTEDKTAHRHPRTRWTLKVLYCIPVFRIHRTDTHHIEHLSNLDTRTAELVAYVKETATNPDNVHAETSHQCRTLHVHNRTIWKRNSFIVQYGAREIGNDLGDVAYV